MTAGGYNRRLGERLRQARNDHGWSLTTVEDLSGGALKAVLIGSYERGDRHPTLDRLAQIAAVYGISVHDLVPEPKPRTCRCGRSRSCSGWTTPSRPSCGSRTPGARWRRCSSPKGQGSDG